MSTDTESSAGTGSSPRWLSEITRLLPIRSQFVISGNVRDIFLCDGKLLPALDAIYHQLQARGFKFLAVYDRTDGLTIPYADPAFRKGAEELLGSGKDTSLDRLPALIRTLVTTRDIRGALVIDYASRLMMHGEPFSEQAANLFVACEKAANSAVAVFIKEEGGVPLFNPVIWLSNREHDLPSWFSLDNELIASQTVPLPDYEERMAAASLLISQFVGGTTTTEDEKARFSREFATLTEGFTLRSMFSVAMLARSGQIQVNDVDDAVRSYKVGISESPWKKPYLKEKVRNAASSISTRVKGQDRAIAKSLDILIRSIMGMTGAQSSSTSGRPRGVLFFAGPTGVGKTELAKAITETLFGDDRAYIRFDMSEFSQEHSDARLLGAPPGYVGYEAGGELTRAVRNRPFSVILFDEIEKAHPRILDKFLQILEDGRLTDGQGQTVYFSESVIIFTSNLGTYVTAADGSRVQNVSPGDPYEQVEQKMRTAIQDHFVFVLNRPEILNRIGDNIVVFNFITPEIAEQIFNGMFNNVLAKVKDEHGITLQVSEEVRRNIQKAATEDMAHGGRGIGNRIESLFVEPLARALFERSEQKNSLEVVAWEHSPSGYRVVIA